MGVGSGPRGCCLSGSDADCGCCLVVWFALEACELCPESFVGVGRHNKLTGVVGACAATSPLMCAVPAARIPQVSFGMGRNAVRSMIRGYAVAPRNTVLARCSLVRRHETTPARWSSILLRQCKGL